MGITTLFSSDFYHPTSKIKYTPVVPGIRKWVAIPSDIIVSYLVPMAQRIFRFVTPTFYLYRKNCRKLKFIHQLTNTDI